MARHAQPLELAQLKGADKQNPQRYRAEPPKLDIPIGLCPSHLDDQGQKAWFELVTYALPGVLTGADRMIMETTAELVGQFRSDPKGFSASKLGQMIGCLARLGLSPADRQKLGKEKAAETNPFDKF